MTLSPDPRRHSIVKEVNGINLEHLPQSQLSEDDEISWVREKLQRVADASHALIGIPQSNACEASK